MTWLLVPTYVFLGVLSVVLIVIDIRERRLPNAWTLSAYPVFLALLLIPTVITDQWDALLRAVLGAILTVLVLWVLASVRTQGLGMGDVKLAGALAMPLAWHSWTLLLLGIAGAFVLSAVFSVVLLSLGRARASTLIPFGPFLLAATWLVIGVG